MKYKVTSSPFYIVKMDIRILMVGQWVLAKLWCELGITDRVAIYLAFFFLENRTRKSNVYPAQPVRYIEALRICLTNSYPQQLSTASPNWKKPKHKSKLEL